MATATTLQNQNAPQSNQRAGQTTAHTQLPVQTENSEPPRQSVNANNRQLAKALGWFSIGLGAAQIIAPNGLARLVGVGNHPLLFRALGAREIASGVGILAGGSRPVKSVWSRVAGDALDLALLGAALATTGNKGRAATAAVAVAGVTALDYYCAQALTQEKLGADGKITVERSITIGKSPDELYRIWRQPETLTRIMSHFADARATGETTSHWKINQPIGKTIEWDAQITEERPGEFVGWQSGAGADLENVGSIRFRPAQGNRGTEATLQFRFAPFGGRIGLPLAEAFDPIHKKVVGQALRKFKALAETGEIPTLERNPSARGSGDTV